MSTTINLTTAPQSVPLLTGNQLMTVEHTGGNMVYYRSTSNVGPQTNDGVLTLGQTTQFYSGPVWFASDSTAQIIVTYISSPISPATVVTATSPSSTVLPLTYAPAPSGGDDTAALQPLVVSGRTVQLQQGAKYLCSLSLSGISNLTVDFNGATLHNTTAGQDAFKAVNCPDLTLRDGFCQGTSGTRDGLHLEGCQRARLVRMGSGGSGRAMCWAQKCVGVVLDGCKFSVNVGPFGNVAANAQAGCVLTWDGADVTSGCNRFLIDGGEYIVGQTPQSSTNTSQFAPGWNLCVIRADGGTIDGPITELGAGGVYAQFCNNLTCDGYYDELNPSDVSYETGTITVVNASASVTGSGTTWNNAATPPEVANGAAGKYLVAPLAAGMTFAKVASVGGATSLTLATQNELLASNWSGSGAAGIAYRLTSFAVFLDGCADCTLRGGRGGAAIALRASNRNRIFDCTCEQVFLDGTSSLNKVEVTVNRATSNASRVVDLGAGNRVRQMSYQSGALIADATLYNPGAAQAGNYSTLESVRAPNATRPVLVVANMLTGTAAANVQALCDASNPPTTPVGQIQLASGGASEQLVMPLVFVVAPGFFYKIHAISGSPSIAAVYEYAL